MEATSPAGHADLPSRVVTRLARMLHSSGMPAHELEERMEQASRWLGAPAHFFSTPTSLFVSFERDPPSTHLVRVTPPGVNLELLSRLHELVGRIETGRLDAAAVDQAMASIQQSPPLYHPAASVVA